MSNADGRTKPVVDNEWKDAGQTSFCFVPPRQEESDMRGRCVGKLFLQLNDAVGICTYLGMGLQDVPSFVVQLDVGMLEEEG